MKIVLLDDKGATLDWVSGTNRNIMREWVSMTDLREARKDEK